MSNETGPESMKVLNKLSGGSHSNVQHDEPTVKIEPVSADQRNHDGKDSGKVEEKKQNGRSSESASNSSGRPAARINTEFVAENAGRITPPPSMAPLNPMWISAPFISPNSGMANVKSFGAVNNYGMANGNPANNNCKSGTSTGGSKDESKRNQEQPNDSGIKSSAPKVKQEFQGSEKQMDPARTMISLASPTSITSVTSNNVTEGSSNAGASASANANANTNVNTGPILVPQANHLYPLNLLANLQPVQFSVNNRVQSQGGPGDAVASSSMQTLIKSPSGSINPNAMFALPSNSARAASTYIVNHQSSSPVANKKNPYGMAQISPISPQSPVNNIKPGTSKEPSTPKSQPVVRSRSTTPKSQNGEKVIRSRSSAHRVSASSRNSSSRVSPVNGKKDEVFDSSKGVVAFIPKEGSNRDAWQPSEDERLIEIVERMGPKRWTHIARILGTGRSSKQCRERWSNQINPSLIRDKWTPEEDKAILEAHRRYGNRWALIAKLLPGRTDNMIKNRFNGSLRIRISREAEIKEKMKEAAKTDAKKKTEKADTTMIKSESKNTNDDKVDSQDFHGENSKDVSSKRKFLLDSNAEVAEEQPKWKKPAVTPTPIHTGKDVEQPELGSQPQERTPPNSRNQGIRLQTVSPRNVNESRAESKVIQFNEWKKIDFDLQSGTKGTIFWNAAKQLATLVPPFSGTRIGLIQVKVPEGQTPLPTQSLINDLVFALSRIENDAKINSGTSGTGVENKNSSKDNLALSALRSLTEMKNAFPSSNHLNMSFPSSNPKWGDISWPESENPCRCRKSKCLKLYCECFSMQKHCSSFCQCSECANLQGNIEWRSAYLRCITRTPGVFGKKKVNVTCKCKNTRCLKKYCDCFRTGAQCTSICRCIDCLNKPDAFDANGFPQARTQMTNNAHNPDIMVDYPLQKLHQNLAQL